MVYNFYNAGACVTWPGEADHRRNAAVCGLRLQHPTLNVERSTPNVRSSAHSRELGRGRADSGGRRFAHTQAHAYDAEDAVAFLLIAARIEIARAREIDIDDFLMIAKRCWPIGRRQPI